MDICVSLTLAQGDFSTTDLAHFANSEDTDLDAVKPPSRHHLSILELLNPLDHTFDVESVDEAKYAGVGLTEDNEDVPMESWMWRMIIKH